MEKRDLSVDDQKIILSAVEEAPMSLKICRILDDGGTQEEVEVSQEGSLESSKCESRTRETPKEEIGRAGAGSP
jgi:hypothetical protein